MTSPETTNDLTLEDALDLVMADHINNGEQDGRNYTQLIVDVRADTEITHDEIDAWLESDTVDHWVAAAYHLVIDATDDQIATALPG